jgi:hypothetical protein
LLRSYSRLAPCVATVSFRPSRATASQKSFRGATSNKTPTMYEFPAGCFIGRLPRRPSPCHDGVSSGVNPFQIRLGTSRIIQIHACVTHANAATTLVSHYLKRYGSPDHQIGVPQYCDNESPPHCRCRSDPRSTMICLKYLANRGRYVRNNTLWWLYLDFKSPPEYFCAQSKRWL